MYIQYIEGEIFAADSRAISASTYRSGWLWRASLQVEVFHLEKCPSFINTYVDTYHRKQTSRNGIMVFTTCNIVIYQYEFYNADSNREFKRKRASTRVPYNNNGR